MLSRIFNFCSLLLFLSSCSSTDPYEELFSIRNSLAPEYSMYFSQKDWIDQKDYYDAMINSIDVTKLDQIERNNFEQVKIDCEIIFAQHLPNMISPIPTDDNKGNNRDNSYKPQKDTIVVVHEKVVYVVDTTKQGGSLPIIDTTRRNTFWNATFPERNVKLLEEACDFNLPATKQFANKLARKAEVSSARINIEQICEIYDYCRSKWSYINDPVGHEYLAKASETIGSELTGDCDDFATLIAACILSIGGEVRVTTAFGPEGGHAYTEVEVSHLDWDHIK
ncbi:MAG: transglutaminase domain-containing protein, partial [Bacteroidales bacterium]|nr:transglutaminase domain-containing protein [Candidatus Scybalocola fimicaballi]